MRNIFLEISYCGKNYHGWQIQPNAVTVQEVLQNTIEILFNEKVNISGCSRTDAGVHANVFCCNFILENEIPTDKIPFALNGVLPGDISIINATEMPLDFHARFNCKGKRYVYKLYDSVHKNPFYDGLVLHYPYKTNVDLMNNQAKDFIGKYDFTSFCAAGSSVDDKTRTIFSFDVERKNDMIVFSVSGDGFLYNMVRIMVGTLLDISRGKIEKNSIRNIIESKNRDNAGVTVPPYGLYLDEVFY